MWGRYSQLNDVFDFEQFKLWHVYLSKFSATFQPLRLCYVNTSTCFSKDAENLTTYGYVL